MVDVKCELPVSAVLTSYEKNELLNLIKNVKIDPYRQYDAFRHQMQKIANSGLLPKKFVGARWRAKRRKRSECGAR